MAEAGLLGMTAPEKFGGSGADSVALAIAVEEIARADASCSLVLSMANSLSVLTLLRYGTPEQQSHYIPQVASGKTLACFAMSEPHAGSNAAKMRTRESARESVTLSPAPNSSSCPPKRRAIA